VGEYEAIHTSVEMDGCVTQLGRSFGVGIDGLIQYAHVRATNPLARCVHWLAYGEVVWEDYASVSTPTQVQQCL
jgi:hypothetical protein